MMISSPEMAWAGIVSWLRLDRSGPDRARPPFAIGCFHRLPGVFLAILILLCVVPCATAETDKEPNDTPSTALPISLPSTTVAGNISGYSDLDYYVFSITYQREVTIWLQTATVGSGLPAALSVYDSGAKLMAYNDGEVNLTNWRSEGDPILYMKLPAGTYYVLVTSRARFRNKQPAPLPSEAVSDDYVLNFFPRFDGPATGDPYEPNDTMQTAFSISLPFQSGTANLLYFGDIDWYSFTAKKGEKISVDIGALEYQSKPGFELVASTRIGIFDGYGRLLQSATEGRDPDTGFEGDPTMVFDAPGDGKYYLAVTVEPDTKFATAFRDQQFLLNPFVGSSAHRIGYYQLRVRTILDLYFPQIANGSFGEMRYVTSIILLNTSEQTAQGELKLYKSDGSPLIVAFPKPAPAGSSYWYSIPPGGEIVVRTDGEGIGTAGYAVLKSTASIAGTAVFSQYDGSGALITEAAVEASKTLDFFTFPVDFNGNFNTGLAVANISGTTPANLTMRLHDSSGKILASRNMSLEPGRQSAIFVGGADQLFPGIPSVRGSLQVFSDLPVCAIALRSSAHTLTTLPPVSLNQSYQPVQLLFPQIVVGMADNYYRTTIMLTNPGYFPVTGTLRFTGAEGTPMPVDINSRVSAVHSFTVSAQGSLFLETSPAGQYSSGYATLEADHGIGGLVIYSQYERSTGRLQTEVAVKPAAQAKRFALFAQNEGSYTTGLALANLSPDTAVLEFQIQSGLDPQDVKQSGPVNLEAGKQSARLVSGTDQIFAEFAGHGILSLASSQPLFAVALRITATTMTALPVIPLP